jgi:hypothetical protein
MDRSNPLIRLEVCLVGACIAAATVGYVLSVPNLELVGILGACIAFGLLIARAYGGSPPSGRG